MRPKPCGSDIISYNCFEATRLRSTLVQAACVIILGCLWQKPEAYMLVSPNLPRFRGPGIEALERVCISSSTRSQSVQKKLYRWK